jgi:hypothetical protein
VPLSLVPAGFQSPNRMAPQHITHDRPARPELPVSHPFHSVCERRAAHHARSQFGRAMCGNQPRPCCARPGQPANPS